LMPATLLLIAIMLPPCRLPFSPLRCRHAHCLYILLDAAAITPLAFATLYAAILA